MMYCGWCPSNSPPGMKPAYPRALSLPCPACPTCRASATEGSPAFLAAALAHSVLPSTAAPMHQPPPHAPVINTVVEGDPPSWRQLIYALREHSSEVAHDIKNPLSGVLSLTQTVMQVGA